MKNESCISTTRKPVVAAAYEEQFNTDDAADEDGVAGSTACLNLQVSDSED